MRRSQWRFGDLRLVLIGVFFVAAWVGIGYRLFLVQGADAAVLAQRGFDQRVRHEVIEPKRGTVFDRDGVELAISVEGRALVADPGLIDDPAGTAAALAPALTREFSDLQQRLTGDGRFVYLARRLGRTEAQEVAAIIEAEELDGLSLVEEPLRVYPSGRLAAPVLGLTRLEDNRGFEGIEAAMDDVLVGKPGKRIVERDPSGRAIPQGQYLIEPARPGSDVVLTLDREIQFAAEQALAAALERSNAEGGSVTVMDPRTGEILAMVSAPGFDPNDRTALLPETVQNRATSHVYEPGSTLKVVTVAAALEEGIANRNSAFPTPHTLRIGGEEYTDHGYNPETMSVEDIVTRSSNVGTIMIQRSLGNQLHYQYLDAFGLGRPTAIDFTSEASGRLDPISAWTSRTRGPSAAIGYGVGVTPLQMASVFSTIANDGEWVEPHVVAEIIDGDGDRTTTEPRRRPVVSPTTALTLRRMLEGVVSYGTGQRAAIDGFTVGGKTGTTQKFLTEEGRYSEEDTIAWFVGVAPIDEPRVVVAVVIDSPRGELEDGTDLRFGGGSAAPVFAEVAESALHQLGAIPDLATNGDEEQ
jgi:cell division protein FtsI (penicillin-binding protein 3)